MKFASYGYLIKEGFKSIWNNRIMSFASIGVLISCLLLTGAAELIAFNVSNLVKEIGNDNMITVYLDDDINEVEAVVKIGPALREVKNVSDAVFVSKDEAIEAYEEDLGEWYYEMTGDGNPLPNAFHVTMIDLSEYKDTVDLIKAVDGVQEVSDRSEIANKLTAMNELVKIVGFWLIVILGIISLFIISNTIRMTMYSRRFEISIMKSVGATNNIVRIPFLVEGMTIGIISGVLSSVILFFVYDGISSAVQSIAPYIKLISYNNIYLEVTLIFILTGCVIGAFGSILSMHKYLKKEGGEILGW